MHSYFDLCQNHIILTLSVNSDMRVGPCPLLPLQFTVEFYKLLLDCYPLTSVLYIILTLTTILPL